MPDVAADVGPAVEGPLVGLLRAPAVVVHDERDDVDPVTHGRLELLRVHQESAVAVNGEHGRVRAAELGAESDGEREPEPAEIERREKGPRPRELQTIVPAGGRGAGVVVDDGGGRTRSPAPG